VLIAGTEREPMFVFALMILFTAFEVFFFAALVIGATWVLDELSAWTVFVGNLLAAASMLAYFFKNHRTLARRMAAAWAEED
jgi:O-antigen/teichoic acid export membrane protein